MVSGHIIRECFIYWSRLLALLLHTYFKAPGLHPKALSVYLIWTILCLLVRNFLLFLLAARTCHADYESLINSFLIQNLFCCLESERQKRDTSYTHQMPEKPVLPWPTNHGPCISVSQNPRSKYPCYNLILMLCEMTHWQNIAHVRTSITDIHSLLYLL